MTLKRMNIENKCLHLDKKYNHKVDGNNKDNLGFEMEFNEETDFNIEEKSS